MTQTDARGLTAVVGLEALEHDRAARAIYAALALDGRVEPVPGGWPLAWRARDLDDVDAVRAANRLNDITATLAEWRRPTPITRDPQTARFRVPASVADVDALTEARHSSVSLGISILAALLWGGILGAAVAFRLMTQMPR